MGRSPQQQSPGALRAASPGSTGLPIRTTLSRPREKKADGSVWGYVPRPGSPSASPAVLKWVQSLDLSQSITNPRRDLQNGYVVAEMLARLYPGEVRMTTFENGIGEKVRRDNWEQITKLAARKGLALAGELAEGTLQGSHGSALALLEFLYESTTGKKVQRMPDPSTIPGMELATASALPTLSFGDAPGADAGGLRSMKPGAGSSGLGGSGAPAFGAPQTQAIGDAMALRRKYGTGG